MAETLAFDLFVCAVHPVPQAQAAAERALDAAVTGGDLGAIGPAIAAAEASGLVSASVLARARAAAAALEARPAKRRKPYPRLGLR